MSSASGCPRPAPGCPSRTPPSVRTSWRSSSRRRASRSSRPGCTGPGRRSSPPRAGSRPIWRSCVRAACASPPSRGRPGCSRARSRRATRRTWPRRTRRQRGAPTTRSSSRPTARSSRRRPRTCGGARARGSPRRRSPCPSSPASRGPSSSSSRRRPATTRSRAFSRPPGSREVDELFLSSSIREVMPVVSVDGVPVGGGAPGPAAIALQQALRSVAGVPSSE